MTYPHIMAEIARTPWAITPEALAGILSAVSDPAPGADRPPRETFHAADIGRAEAVASMLGDRPEGTRFTQVRDGVGSIHVDGPIVPRASAFTDVSGLTSIDRLQSEFARLEADPGIRKILLVMDSPGGAVTGVSEFTAQIRASAKPTAAYVYGMAASAAYWIASAADEIISADTGIVGSIGVVLGVRRDDKDTVTIVSSQSPAKRPDVDSEEGRGEYLKLVDAIAETFIATVATNRNTTAAKVQSDFGRGGVVLPPRSVTAGMVDGVATLATYFAELSASTPIPGREKIAATYVDNSPDAGENRGTGARPPRMEARMNLQELLTDNPAAQADIDAMIAKSSAEARADAVAKLQAANAQAGAILASSEYPEPIRAIAADVVTGASDPGELRTAVRVYDALRAAGDIAAAVADSAAAGSTPGQQTDTPSTDGVIRSQADLVAEAKALKEGR